MNVGEQHMLIAHLPDVFLKDNASQHRASGCTNLCPEKENEETIIVPVKKSRKKVVAEKKEPGAVVEDANGAAERGVRRPCRCLTLTLTLPLEATRSPPHGVP